MSSTRSARGVTGVKSGDQVFGLGQGAAAVQIAAARGATVIGTASKANHDFLRELGARPVTYGEGLAERVTAAAPEASTPRWTPPASGSLADIVALVGDASRVATVAAFGSPPSALPQDRWVWSQCGRGRPAH